MASSGEQAAAAAATAAGDGGWQEGVDFVSGVYNRLGLKGIYIQENWPSPIAKLFRMYKSAGRTFAKHLYEVSSDLIPGDVLPEIAQQQWKIWEDEWEGGEYVEDVKLLDPEALMTMAIGVDMYSSAERVHPEMMLALATAIEGRNLVDLWCRKDRAQRPFDASAERKGKNHERFTQKLEEVMEKLRPAFEKHHPELASSLKGVEDATWVVYKDLEP